MGSSYFCFVISDGNKERKPVNDGRMCGVSGKGLNNRGGTSKEKQQTQKTNNPLITTIQITQQQPRQQLTAIEVATV